MDFDFMSGNFEHWIIEETRYWRHTRKLLVFLPIWTVIKLGVLPSGSDRQMYQNLHQAHFLAPFLQGKSVPIQSIEEYKFLFKPLILSVPHGL